MPRSGALAAIVAARNEADRIGETLAALRGAFPGAAIWVADDASTDGTAEAAMAAGAQVVSRGRPHGKGANVTAAAEAALSAEPAPDLVLLCDGDLGASAARLAPAGRGGRAAASATSPSPPSAAASAAASASRSASPAGRSAAAAARDERADLRPAGDAGRGAARRSAVRPRLRHGDRDDGRRRARRLPRCASTSSTSSTAPPAARSPASPTAAASCATSPASYLSPQLTRGWPAVVILAIDQGTTGTTCLVFDEEGGSPGGPTRSSSSTSRGRAGSSTTPTRSGR